MDTARFVTLAALAVTLLGDLPALTGSHIQSELPLVSGLGPAVSEGGADRTEGQLLLPCSALPAQPPPSSVHSVRPSDISTVAAIGALPPILPGDQQVQTDRSAVATVIGRLSELLSLFNPELSTLQLDHTHQHRSLSEQAEALALSLRSSEARPSDRGWRLILLFSGEQPCPCDTQVSPAVQSAVEQVESAVQVLHRQVPRALVSVVPWVGQTGQALGGRRCGQCEGALSAAGVRLTDAVLTRALEEALEQQLVEKQWYNDREDFTVHIQALPTGTGTDYKVGGRETPAGHDALRLALQLWTGLLQPMGEQPAMEDNDISPVVCPTKDCPFLRTHRNSFPSSPQPRSRTLHKSNATPPTPTHTPTSTQNHTTTHSSTPTVPKPLDPVLGSELHCTDHSPSDTPPTSVHYLRPGDIKVVAAIGDSLTAGNGVGANPNNILDVLKQYRGLSWSIGGDQTLNTVTTLPNLLRRFNAALTGFSVGIGNTAANAFLNQAQPGATTVDLPGQVHTLVKLMKQDQRVDFQRDWKLVTVFIGGNDLCDYCTDSIYFSPRNFMIRIQQALDILHKEVPRVFVNLVEPMHITPLRRLHQDRSLGCPTLIVNILCRCVVKPKEGSRELQTLNDLNRAYQRAVLELVDSGRYDTRDDFTVVVQPFFREVVLPLLQDGRPDRTFFTPDCFHLSQKAQSHMARSLWNNMLEPLGNKTDVQNFTTGFTLHCPSQHAPFLRTYRNSNYSYPDPDPTEPPIKDWGSDLTCKNRAPSDSPPTSAHRLRPGDVRVVAALGDSLSAGFGVRAKSILTLKTEWRGLSWSIGGDKKLETVTTLPNILKEFNPSLFGFSTGQGKANTRFNMAQSGAKAADIPEQVENLIQALKDSPEVDFDNDWKMVTLFIGGNDLCQYCLDRDTLSVQNYSQHLRDSLDLLYREVPRVFVNLLEILQIEGLRRIKDDSLGCSLLQKNMCPCFLIPGEDSLELSEIKRVNREYQMETERLVSGGRYDGREDFTVVIQPYFRNSIIPLAADGKPDLSFFSVDCFHFSERGHAEMAIALWNNMLEPVGRKQVYNNFTHNRRKIHCPSKDQPYFFTRNNSFPWRTPSTLPAINTVPLWAAMVILAAGLLIGCLTTWLLLSRKAQQRVREKERGLELPSTAL